MYFVRFKTKVDGKSGHKRHIELHPFFDKCGEKDSPVAIFVFDNAAIDLCRGPRLQSNLEN